MTQFTPIEVLGKEWMSEDRRLAYAVYLLASFVLLIESK
jgi:hypothetical protein